MAKRVREGLIKIREKFRTRGIIALGIGAGVGTATPFLLERLGIAGQIPFVPLPYSDYRVGIPLFGGIGAIIAAGFLKQEGLREFLAAFGASSIVAAIIKAQSMPAGGLRLRNNPGRGRLGDPIKTAVARRGTLGLNIHGRSAPGMPLRRTTPLRGKPGPGGSAQRPASTPFVDGYSPGGVSRPPGSIPVKPSQLPEIMTHTSLPKRTIVA